MTAPLSLQKDLESDMDRLKNACGDRQFHLGSMKGFHEYMREAEEMDEWISEQMVQAASEDYGHDYEHCQVSNLQ